ncbi:MAG: MBL fold metallo-hydrolase, partial [Lysobacter sp.]
MSACLLFTAKTQPSAEFADSPQFTDGRFRNPVPRPATGARKMLQIIGNALWNKPADAAPVAAPPVLALSPQQLA